MVKTFQAASCQEPSEETKPLVLMRLRVGADGLEVTVNLIGQGFASDLVAKLGMKVLPSSKKEE